MKKIIRAGATDQTLDVFIQDSASTTGAGKTGLAHNTASLTCYYRKGATGTATALTLVTQTVGGAHADGGFVEIDATNMPGMYRLDLSDTIVATAGTVTLMLKGASGMAPLPIELQVVAVNLEDAVRMGLTALPNAAADAAGGLPISDAGGLDLDTLLARLDAAISTRLASAGYTAPLDAAGTRTAVGLASANLDTQLGDLPTVSEFNARTLAAADYATAAALATVDGIVDDILTDTGTTLPGLLSTIAGYIDTEIAAIKAKTDNLPASPAATGDAMTLTSGERSTLAAAILDLANAIEIGLTLRQAMRLQTAAAAGKLSGAASTTVILRNAVADSKDRIVATVDADGNRSAITVDLT